MVNGRTMDYTQIKNVQMSDYLQSIGCNPTKVQYGSAWYLSPFRQERTASLAFPNDKGGYELRNAFFKTGSSPKYFTTIPGKDETRVSIFEGFMDFLSCCSYYGRSPKSRTVILNSLSFLQRLEPTLGEFRSIHLYLDNDPAGREATRRLIDRFGQAKDLAQDLYPGCKDFNEFWIK